METAQHSGRVIAVRRHLEREYGLAEAETLDILQSFVQNLEELHEEMEVALRKEQWSDLNHAGHSLKGVAANVGQTDLSRLGHEIETASLTPLTAGQVVPPMVAHFAAALHEFLLPSKS